MGPIDFHSYILQSNIWTAAFNLGGQKLHCCMFLGSTENHAAWPPPALHCHQLPALKNDTEYLEPIVTAGRENPDSLTEKMVTVHPHITKPFKTAIAKQPLFQDSLNVEREYYLSRLQNGQQVE